MQRNNKSENSFFVNDDFDSITLSRISKQKWFREQAPASILTNHFLEVQKQSNDVLKTHQSGSPVISFSTLAMTPHQPPNEAKNNTTEGTESEMQFTPPTQQWDGGVASGSTYLKMNPTSRAEQALSLVCRNGTHTHAHSCTQQF